MNYEAFVQKVEEQTDLDSRNEVTNAADATLRTLSQRISHGEANDIAGRLPDDLADSITADDNERAEEISTTEFVERVQTYEREHTTLEPSDAKQHVRAVLGSLSEEINGSEWRNMQSQLPSEYGQLY